MFKIQKFPLPSSKTAAFMTCNFKNHCDLLISEWSTKKFISVTFKHSMSKNTIKPRKGKESSVRFSSRVTQNMHRVKGHISTTKSITLPLITLDLEQFLGSYPLISSINLKQLLESVFYDHELE